MKDTRNRVNIAARLAVIKAQLQICSTSLEGLVKTLRREADKLENELKRRKKERRHPTDPEDSLNPRM